MPSKLVYKFIGPTTIHLHHELVLLATLTIFTCASLYTSYHSNRNLVHYTNTSHSRLSSTSSSSGDGNGKSSFLASVLSSWLSLIGLSLDTDIDLNFNCHWNEFLYLLLSSLWLSRHLIHRIICTTEVNVNVTSSCIGVGKQIHPFWLSTLYKVYIWVSCDGQYFDIPFCPIHFAVHNDHDVVATSITSNAAITNTNTTSSSLATGTIAKTVHTNNISAPIHNTSTMRTIIEGVSNTIKTPKQFFRRSTTNSTITTTESSSFKLHNRNIMNKTPPFHRLYIIQRLFIIPFIVLPISIMKYLFNLLRSRKRPKHQRFYDSDDDDLINSASTIHNKNSKNSFSSHILLSSSTSNNNSVLFSSHTLSSNNNNSSNNDILLWDNYDNINEEYIQIYTSTQRRINTQLDTLWTYIPSIQCIVYIVTLLVSLHIGRMFYMTYIQNTYYASTISSNNGLFTLDKNFNDDHYLNSLTMQQQQQQIQEQGQQQQITMNGVLSTVLNSKLMSYKFKVKHENMFGGGGTTSRTSSGNINDSKLLYGNGSFYTKCMIIASYIADKFGIRNWVITFYGPWGMFYLISIWGLVGSLLVFGRIMLPLPDLTAGSGRDNWNGKGTSRSNKQKRREEKSSWSESYTSVTSANRFLLHGKILLIRIIENIMICAIIPQSSYMCKATGYCNIEPTIFEMGNPTAIDSGAVYGGYNHKSRSYNMFDNLIRDRFVGHVIVLSVVVTSIMMLVGQILALDRSTLALEANKIMQGYVNGGNGGRRGSNSYNEPFTTILPTLTKYVYQTFSMEIGAISTSGIISMIFNICAIHSIVIVILIVYYGATNRDCYPLVLTLIALFTAAGGSDLETLDFYEIDDIANEINALHEN